MFIPLILLFGLTVATAVIAYWSDNLGKKLGKKRVSLFGLRPRTTATILTISSSWAIMLFTLAFLLITVAPLRRALFRYQRDRDQYRSDITSAKKQLEGTKNRLAGTQNQLSQIQNSFLSARKQLGQARAALTQAHSNLQSARESVKQARAGEKTARLGASDAQNRAKTAQNLFIAAQNRFLNAQNQYKRAQNLFAAAQNRARAAQQREKIARSSEILAEQRAGVARSDLQQTQNRLAQTRGNLKNANLSLDNAAKSFRRIAEDLLRLQQQQYELQQQVGALASGDVKTTVGQVFAAGIIEAGKSRKLIEANLLQLLERGRKSLPEGATLELSPLTAQGNGGKIELQGQKLIETLARDIAANGQRTSIRLVASRNFLEGEKRLEAVFVAVPEVVAFRADETLASAAIDGSAGDARIFRALLDLTDAGRQLAVSRRVNPPQSPQEPNFYASGTNVALFAALRRIEASKQVQQVRLIAADDLSTVEPLRVRFEIETSGDSP